MEIPAGALRPSHPLACTGEDSPFSAGCTQPRSWPPCPTPRVAVAGLVPNARLALKQRPPDVDAPVRRNRASRLATKSRMSASRATTPFRTVVMLARHNPFQTPRQSLGASLLCCARRAEDRLRGFRSPHHASRLDAWRKTEPITGLLGGPFSTDPMHVETPRTRALSVSQNPPRRLVPVGTNLIYPPTPHFNSRPQNDMLETTGPASISEHPAGLETTNSRRMGCPIWCFTGPPAMTSL
jgi:hypothetical protein